MRLVTRMQTFPSLPPTSQPFLLLEELEEAGVRVTGQGKGEHFTHCHPFSCRVPQAPRTDLWAASLPRDEFGVLYGTLHFNYPVEMVL